MKLALVLPVILYLMDNQCVADDEEPVSYRIVEHQEPKRYTLDLEFNKEIFEGTSSEFTGFLTINFKVKRTIRSIQLHAPVTIKSKELIDNETYTVDIESEFFDPVTHTYTITAKENLNYTHNYLLNLEYSAQVNTTDMEGVFRSNYLDEDGNENYFIATQFKPTFARFAFPCFDEPKMTASFLISITYPRGFTALSNSMENGSATVVE